MRDLLIFWASEPSCSVVITACKQLRGRASKHTTNFHLQSRITQHLLCYNMCEMGDGRLTFLKKENQKPPILPLSSRQIPGYAPGKLHTSTYKEVFAMLCIQWIKCLIPSICTLFESTLFTTRTQQSWPGWNSLAVHRGCYSRKQSNQILYLLQGEQDTHP